jgi:hypothetical protein
VGEVNGVADGPAEGDAQLVGDALRDGARGQPPRLRVGDRRATQLQAQLRQLRRLARPGLSGHDDHLVIADRLEQVDPTGADRQLRRVVDHLGDDKPIAGGERP